VKLVIISDTHDQHPEVPSGDVLIHCGDFACGDDLASLRRDIRWLKSLPCRHKILVKGNHDLILKCRPDARDLLDPVVLLEDSEVTIDGVTFYGVGWKSTVSVPQGIDVVISHEPPAGVLDGGIGSQTLRREILLGRPRVHVFGHAHGARGHVVHDGTHFYNATLEHPTTDVVGAMSHSVVLPTDGPWIHELEVT
jgi:predicted phosphohydrolase